MSESKKTTKNNQSVTKVLSVLEAMAEHGKPIRLKKLAETVSIPESTTLRLLISLTESGYVTQNAESQKYTLTYKIVRVANQFRASFSLIEIARPYLKELSQKCQESVCLAIDQDSKVVHIDTVDGPNNILQTLQKVGKSVPLYCSGIGKNLLLNYSEERIRSLYATRGFTPFTPYTITSADELLQEIAQVRKQGYAYDKEETELGACCIAAPIHNYNGKVVAGISVSGPSLRMTPEKMDAIRTILLRISGKISAMIQHSVD